MPGNDKRGMRRRGVLGALGGTAAAGLAGCVGMGGGGGDGGEDEVLSAAQEIGFSDNWQDRRLASFDDWPIEARRDIPDPSSDAFISKEGWKNSGAIQNANWTPPEGWDDTAAGDVDTLQILNFGSLDFDPATLATYALFEEKTGITLEPLEIVVDQATPKEAAFLSAEEPEPQMMCVTAPSSFTSFVANGYLQDVSPVTTGDMWDAYIPSTQQAFTFDGSTYMGPNINEGDLVHTRPQMMLDQGVDQSVVDRITNLEWDWNDLETVMKAFEGTGQYGWAYRGSSLTYTYRDWLKHTYQAGGSLVSDDGTVTFNSDAAVVALEKMVEWLDKGWVPDAVTSYTQGDLADGFLSGQFAMVPVYGDLVPRAVDQFGQEPEYQPTVPPKGVDPAPSPERKGITTPTGMAINNFADTASKLAGMVYLDCRYSTEPMWHEFVDEGNQTFMKQVFSQAAETDSALYSDIRGQSIEMSVLEIYPSQRNIRQRVSEELQVAIAGDKEPQEALDAAQEFANTILGQ